jgi:hypothetical protein
LKNEASWVILTLQAVFGVKRREGKLTEEKDRRVALKIMVGDSEREVTFDELVLSNNLAQEALVRLLVAKKIFKPEELAEEMARVRKERYRTPQDLSPKDGT